MNATVMPMEEFLAPPPRPPRRASLPHTTDEEEDKLRIRGNSILVQAGPTSNELKRSISITVSNTTRDSRDTIS